MRREHGRAWLWGAVLASLGLMAGPACENDDGPFGPAVGGGAADAGADAPGGGPPADADAGCPEKPPLPDGGPATDASLYPEPHYVELGQLGAHVATVCFDFGALPGHATLDGLAEALFAEMGVSRVEPSCDCDLAIRVLDAPPDLQGPAATSWSVAQANPEGFVVSAQSVGGRGTVDIFARSERTAWDALVTAGALVQPEAGANSPLRLASALVVDWPELAPRGILEGFYGPPYTEQEHATTVRLMARLRQTHYVYGPKNDEYARTRWAEPYPLLRAEQLRVAAAAARAHLVTFVWSVSPGLPFGSVLPGDSIKYSSDEDFDRLTAKIESVRALGIDAFALFLDDIVGWLVWPQDMAAFPSLATAHAHLMNRLDDYLKGVDPAAHLIVVGSEYTSFWPTWQAYNEELGSLLHPGIEVLWTGPGIYTISMEASDMESIDDALGRKVSLWDNWPNSVGPLTGRSADLPAAVAGFYSNPVINEFGLHPVTDFWSIQGTLADYAWNPAAYQPNASWEKWQPLLGALLP